MEPSDLVSPVNPLGYPAPYWFLLLFKVIGFTLHAVAMSLWYVGIVVALLLRCRGDSHGRQLSTRMMNAMPVIIALGINFGIIPLLFTQVIYYRVFYSATILMAWFWLAIILLLLASYYAVYLYVVALRSGSLRSIHCVAAWTAAGFFLLIGFFFANGMSLMTHLQAWPALWQDSAVGGAVAGTALNIGDPTLWPRWLLMIGIAITTVAVYIVFDVVWLATGQSHAYHRAVIRFAWKLYSVGVIWLVVAGSWYVFGTWSDDLLSRMFRGPQLLVTACTALAPAAPWILLTKIREDHQCSRPLAVSIVAGQFGVVALNAISRQMVQHAELERFVSIGAEELRIQWGAMSLFLVVLIGGIVVVGWMLRQIMISGSRCD